MTEFIFMETYNDMTRSDAINVYKEIRDTKIKFIGFKDIGLPIGQLKELHSMMKKDRRTTFLEVVSASEKETIQSTKVALELGVDYLIGGTYVDSTLPLIKNKNIKYFPYVGKIVDHPCKLRGSIEEMVQDTKKVKEKAIPGINLLAYRYNGDAEKLIEKVSSVGLPMIVAGSIDSYERVRKMKEMGIWAFTIGGAIFDKKFVSNGSLKDNINAVLKEIE
jgi:uncharacterized protein related to proFAR isomerase